MNLVKTGVLGLDEVLKGGIRDNASILIKGPPGCGKTIMALQFILEGCKKGEAGAFITAEENLEDLREYAKSLKFDLEKYEKKRLLYLIKQPIRLKRLISIATPLSLIAKGKIKRVALDSLTIFKYSTEDDLSYRKEILDLIEDMRKVLFIATAEERIDSVDNFSSENEDYLFDGIIRLAKIRRGSNFERVVFIAKMRGQNHSIDIFPFNIKDGGITVYPGEIPFSLFEDEKGKK